MQDIMLNLRTASSSELFDAATIFGQPAANVQAPSSSVGSTSITKESIANSERHYGKLISDVAPSQGAISTATIEGLKALARENQLWGENMIEIEHPIGNTPTLEESHTHSTLEKNDTVSTDHTTEIDHTLEKNQTTSTDHTETDHPGEENSSKINQDGPVLPDLSLDALNDYTRQESCQGQEILVQHGIQSSLATVCNAFNSSVVQAGLEVVADNGHAIDEYFHNQLDASNSSAQSPQQSQQSSIISEYFQKAGHHPEEFRIDCKIINYTIGDISFTNGQASSGYKLDCGQIAPELQQSIQNDGHPSTSNSNKQAILPQDVIDGSSHVQQISHGESNKTHGSEGESSSQVYPILPSSSPEPSIMSAPHTSLDSQANLLKKLEEKLYEIGDIAARLDKVAKTSLSLCSSREMVANQCSRSPWSSIPPTQGSAGQDHANSSDAHQFKIGEGSLGDQVLSKILQLLRSPPTKYSLVVHESVSVEKCVQPWIEISPKDTGSPLKIIAHENQSFSQTNSYQLGKANANQKIVYPSRVAFHKSASQQGQTQKRSLTKRPRQWKTKNTKSTGYQNNSQQQMIGQNSQASQSSNGSSNDSGSKSSAYCSSRKGYSGQFEDNSHSNAELKKSRSLVNLDSENRMNSKQFRTFPTPSNDIWYNNPSNGFTQEILLDQDKDDERFSAQKPIYTSPNPDRETEDMPAGDNLAPSNQDPVSSWLQEDTSSNGNTTPVHERNIPPAPQSQKRLKLSDVKEPSLKELTKYFSAANLEPDQFDPCAL